LKADILILIHRNYFRNKTKKGGFDHAIECLKDSGMSVCLVESELSHSKKSPSITLCHNNKETIIKESKYILLYIKYINRIFEIIWIILNTKKNITSNKCIISVDPLNFITGYLLKKILFNKSLLYFHAIDYSEIRFKNTLINSIYHKCFNFALVQSDHVTCVSKKMLLKFNEIHRSDKYIYFPNSPEYEKCPKTETSLREINSIALSTTLYYGLDYNKIIQTVELLHKKFHGKIHVHVIGDGPYRPYFEKIVKNKKLESVFTFHGLRSQKENLDIISRSKLGLCWLSGTADFNTWGDSIKLREYAACGIPAISDRITSTAIESWENNCCLLVSTVSEAVSAITRYFEDENFYNNSVNSSLKWAKCLDKKEFVYSSIIKKIQLVEFDHVVKL